MNVSVILAEAGARVYTYSGNTLLGIKTGVKGLNSWSLPGLKPGVVKVDVIFVGGGSLTASGGKQVTADATLCNFNYQVVALK